MVDSGKLMKLDDLGVPLFQGKLSYRGDTMRIGLLSPQHFLILSIRMPTYANSSKLTYANSSIFFSGYQENVFRIDNGIYSNHRVDVFFFVMTESQSLRSLESMLQHWTEYTCRDPEEGTPRMDRSIAQPGFCLWVLNLWGEGIVMWYSGI